MVNKRRQLRVESLERRQLMASVSVDSFTTQGDGDYSAPINIDGVQGMRAAEIRIQYDPSMLSADQASVTAGSVWGDSAMVVANVDEAAGTIVAFVFSANEVPQSSGGLINIDFQTSRVPHARRELSIDLQQVRINEGQVKLDIDPVVGADATDTTPRVIEHSRSQVKRFCSIGENLESNSLFPIERERGRQAPQRHLVPQVSGTGSTPAPMMALTLPTMSTLSPTAVDDLFHHIGRHGRRLY